MCTSSPLKSSNPLYRSKPLYRCCRVPDERPISRAAPSRPRLQPHRFIRRCPLFCLILEHVAVIADERAGLEEGQRGADGEAGTVEEEWSRGGPVRVKVVKTFTSHGMLVPGEVQGSQCLSDRFTSHDAWPGAWGGAGRSLFVQPLQQ